jgi:hypothetical protein
MLMRSQQRNAMLGNSHFGDGLLRFTALNNRMLSMKFGVIVCLCAASLALVGCNRTRTTLEGKSAAKWAEDLESPTSATRNHALVALFQISEEDKSAVPYLAKGLKDSTLENRMTAVKLLGNLGPQALEAVPALKESLKDNDAAIRQQAQQAITEIEAKP